MNRLADVAYDSGKMMEANLLYRKVLASQGGDLTTSPEKVLHDKLVLLTACAGKGIHLRPKGCLKACPQPYEEI
jgi:hypothetical protein